MTKTEGLLPLKLVIHPLYIELLTLKPCCRCESFLPTILQLNLQTRRPQLRRTSKRLFIGMSMYFLIAQESIYLKVCKHFFFFGLQKVLKQYQQNIAYNSAHGFIKLTSSYFNKVSASLLYHFLRVFIKIYLIACFHIQNYFLLHFFFIYLIFLIIQYTIKQHSDVLDVFFVFIIISSFNSARN